MRKENSIQSSTPKTLICMKEDLNNFPSQNTKTVCSISELMALVIITPQVEGKFFADGGLFQWITSLGIGVSIAPYWHG